MGEVKTLSPPTRWAQRKDKVFLTIEVADCQTPEIKLESQTLHFSAKGGNEQKIYALDLEFFNEVIPEKSKQHITAREITFIIMKKEEGPYWPRLHKEGKKPSFLHTDFNKWRDEDDSEGEDTGMDDNFEDMMSKMSAGGGQGFDPGELQGEESDDSDDEELPDLES
ncbi:hypothetical protein ACROYT_G026502 [Oculina patagonica]